MILLSADIYSQQRAKALSLQSDLTELQTTLLFAKMLRMYGVKATCFFSSQAVLEASESLQPLLLNPLIEIGAHRGETPVDSAVVSRAAVPKFTVPKATWIQKREILETKQLIEFHTHRPLRSWRNLPDHRYAEKQLFEAGLSLCSSGQNTLSPGPESRGNGHWFFQENITPYQRGPEAYPSENWINQVLAELQAHEAQGIVSHLSLDPFLMYLYDEFQAMGKLLAYLSDRQTLTLTEWRLQAPAVLPVYAQVLSA